ncbi:MAG: putative photosynthetic complex assembly protein PuhE [Pseudomonadota bacterium]
MLAVAMPVLFVITLWWFSTGAVLWLARGRREDVPAKLLGLTVLAAFGFAAAAASANSSAAWAPYLGFVAALAIWAWAEFTFLTGLVTGPRTKACPQGVSEGERFRLAFRTISRHEVALLIALGGVVLITHSGVDKTALLTFATLWVMRVSAKLTIFSGVPALSRDMMPKRIAHMESYFRSDRIGPVFWVATTLSTVALVAAIVALASGWVPAAFHVTGVIVTTLVGLAAFEHWMMILPVRETALWQWAMTKETLKEGHGPLLTETKLPRLN